MRHESGCPAEGGVRPHRLPVPLRHPHAHVHGDPGRTVAAYRALGAGIRCAPEAPIVLGGGGFSVVPDAMLEALGADLGVAGEGEPTFAALVEALDAGGIRDRGKVEVLNGSLNRYAYILFTRDFQENREIAIRGLERCGLHTIGRFGRYDYHNSDQCMRQAMDLAGGIPGA